ncbi:MAG: aminotransferase class I/II-fold pyridoxal phosphate-dependent enzyme [Chitinivibrionales bacterium]|nr:aminotransferase class I/II-fold pyridoxal phosphate-dependent enzyme [Chitinivibrionales bacterium]
MSGRELELVTRAFETNWIAPVGPDIDAFEQEMCAYTAAPHAAAVASGTAAIHLALLLNGVGPGDEVLCSSFTFAGSAFPIAYCGATPVFVDSDEATWNMDPNLLERAIRERTAAGHPPKACILVHLYGIPADIDPIMALCEEHGIVLIEDAAESLGALYKGKHTGTVAPVGIYSFNGNKIITTAGGGMLVGHDAHAIQQARYLATQARDPAVHYEHSRIGYNYRMSNVGAAIGRGQLTALDSRVRSKREICTRYRQLLGGIDGVSFMPSPGYGEPTCWLTCVMLDDARSPVAAHALIEAFAEDNIESRPLWKPMHLQPAFAGCPSFVSGVSERLFRTGVCLPSGTAMSDQEQARVDHVLRTSFRL